MSKHLAAVQPSAPAGAPLWGVQMVRDLVRWILNLHGGPQPLPSYTVAGLPDPTAYMNCEIIVSNESGGRTIATSNGTNWKRVKDGATVS